jgi:hypothetical protein
LTAQVESEKEQQESEEQRPKTFKLVLGKRGRPDDEDQDVECFGNVVLEDRIIQKVSVF